MRKLVVLCWLLLAANPIVAATDAPAADGMESLGRELLDDLSPDAFDQQAIPAANDAERPLPGQPSRRRTRFDDLGEDIGEPSGPLSLARVRQGMQRAESLLDTSNAVIDEVKVTQAQAAQQQVVEQLDELIAQLSKQCQGGQCQSGDQAPKPGERTQSKPGKPGAAAGRGQTAARDSSDRLGGSDAAPVEKGDIDELVKHLWGHLPEREREQMMQSFSEEFLPKYELEIEQYYRRLSEEKEENGAR
jgi:hypothetical protein